MWSILYLPQLKKTLLSNYPSTLNYSLLSTLHLMNFYTYLILFCVDWLISTLLWYAILICKIILGTWQSERQAESQVWGKRDTKLDLLAHGHAGWQCWPYGGGQCQIQVLIIFGRFYDITYFLMYIYACFHAYFRFGHSK